MAATKKMNVLTVKMLATLLVVVHSSGLSQAMDFRGMEENCILSFVVPRDKVKSSCDMEERVTRRLNAMETKVTLYKQHVQELQEQLTKEREFHRQRLQELNERMIHNERNPADGLLQKQIQGLEEEMKAQNESSPVSRAGRKAPQALAAGLGMVPTGRSREEEEKAMTNLVKTVVHSEVQRLFDNYTQYVGRYVRDQALAFNQIMNMVPRYDQSFPHQNLPPNWPNKLARNDIEPTAQPMDRDMVLLNELESIRSRLNNTGKRLVDHMHNVLNNVNVTSPRPTPPTAPSKVTDSSGANAAPSQHDSVRGNGLLDINDTASGDTADIASESNITLAFTQVANNTLHPDAGPQKNLQVPPNGDFSAKSRMSYNADLNKVPEPGGQRAGGRESSARPTRNWSGWEQGMVHDQGAGQWIQVLLRTEMQKILQQQVDEVLSLVSKHSSMVDSKLSDQDSKFSQLEQRLAADIKHLDQVVNGLKLEMTSVSQGLQTLYSRTDKAERLQHTVMELKKNMSMEGGPRLLATLLDEQGKKVRKMERLTDIYKQSLEHHRNETKLEYRDLKERLNKETTVLRALHTDLFHNVTEHAKQLTEQLNASANKHMEEIKQRVQVMEDNSLLLQIDLSSFERQLKSKTSKSERDMSKLHEDVGELKQKTRHLQKNFNSAINVQEKLCQAVNASTKQVQQLQMEVKLNVLDDWLPYNFDYMKTRTDCFGDQFIRKSGFKTGRLVGVVLCSNRRYKIFLGQSPTDTFKNIGDDSGMGEDHCQFVNARGMSKVKVSPFRTSTETEPGYVRTHWGQEPRPELLNIIRPSPAWYECGVSIP